MEEGLNKKVYADSNSLLAIIAIYSLTIFVYRDFSIPSYVGIALLVAAFLFCCLTKQIAMNVSSVPIAFFALMLFQVIEIARAMILGNTTNVMYIPVLLLLALFVLFSKTDMSNVKISYKAWLFVSILVALYICITKIAPGIYSSIFEPFLSAETRAMNKDLVGNGYSVAIGANVIVADYIIAFGVLFCASRLLLKDITSQYKKYFYFAMIVLFIIAMIFINRKTEIVALSISLVFVICLKSNYESIYKRNKKVIALIGAIIFAVVIIYLLYTIDALGRYGVFIDNILSNITSDGPARDISSGRILLWMIAGSLFLKNPIFGIGWGNYADHVPYSIAVSGINEIHNAHNCFLQIMCETGIVGFLIFTFLILFIFIKFVRFGTIMKHNEADYLSRAVMNACTAYQLFFLVTGLIDPTFYSLIFWCLYTVSVIMGLVVYNNAREKTVNTYKNGA